MITNVIIVDVPVLGGPNGLATLSPEGTSQQAKNRLTSPRSVDSLPTAQQQSRSPLNSPRSADSLSQLSADASSSQQSLQSQRRPVVSSSTARPPPARHPSTSTLETSLYRSQQKGCNSFK